MPELELYDADEQVCDFAFPDALDMSKSLRVPVHFNKHYAFSMENAQRSVCLAIASASQGRKAAYYSTMFRYFIYCRHDGVVVCIRTHDRNGETVLNRF